MKGKEYFRLAALSIKSNRRQTSNTVRGVVFGGVLLVFVLFVVCSFYGGIMGAVNAERTVASLTVTYSDLPNTYIDNKYRAEITAAPVVEDSVVYKSEWVSYYQTGGGWGRPTPVVTYYPTVTLDGKEYVYDYTYAYNQWNSPRKISDGFTFYRLSECTAVVTPAEEEYLQKNNLGKGILAGKAFADGEREIVISSRLLDHLGIPYEEAVGKTISYSVPLNDGDCAFIKGENGEAEFIDLQEKEMTLFKDFTIAGVFNEKLYTSPSRGEMLEFAPTFWMKEGVIDDEGIEYYYEEDKIIGYLYEEDPLTLSEKAVTAGKLFLPYGISVNQAGSESYSFIKDNYYTQILQFVDFQSAYEYRSILDYYWSLTAPDHLLGRHTYFDNSIMHDYIEFYPTILIVVVSFSVVGGVVFLATVLNLYNTMCYSAEKRKRYLAMCRAVGMEKGDVLKLYFAETLLVLLRAAVWVAALTFALCLAFTLGVNSLIETGNMETVVSYRFSFGYYPLVMAGTACALTLIAAAIALFCRRGKYEPAALLKE